MFEAFRNGLGDLGYIDGKRVTLDYRFAKGKYDALPELAGELVNVPVDVIVIDGSASTLAASHATRTVPIVTAVGVDPVALGLAASLGRPRGNVTGFSHCPIELMGKRLQLLKYAFPGIMRVAILANSQSTATPDALRIAQQAAGELRVELTTVEAGDPDALRALGPASLAGADGLMTVPDALFWNQRRVIVAFAVAARVPAIYPEREFTDDGGLIAFRANVPDHFRRAAGYVDRILKGCPCSKIHPAMESVCR